ncbi:hypothetical protein L198_03169 [Cryptococcus wingfieldii CBS 7118]|uniref:Uncharacterized protein n=1 Tax=Cryptococcus wingfieldii CBS 7118 TaxID=1295528 RepID=A0A1E3JLN9_9TREE|nr:hypothetical protein L198_03169 [Cryptococcus wingfieldii CBS 7118]ODO00842.1 hypothetical protein L198_03169 [Cryptococcus wingfieldii CBS 7118]
MPFPFHPEAFALLIATLAEDPPAFRSLKDFAACHRFPPLPVLNTSTYKGPRGAHAFQHLAAGHTCTPECHVDRRQFQAANLDSTRWFPDNLPPMNPVYPAPPVQNPAVQNPAVLNRPVVLNSGLNVNSSSCRQSNGNPSQAAPGPANSHDLVALPTALRDTRILRCLLVQILENDDTTCLMILKTIIVHIEGTGAIRRYRFAFSLPPLSIADGLTSSMMKKGTVRVLWAVGAAMKRKRMKPTGSHISFNRGMFFRSLAS